ncbi:MAG: filamentous hemagglutinin N-terminal domain-containing protein [Tepidisphaeraceae bacterium]|jgi:filamentous hemagglutinin family protein
MFQAYHHLGILGLTILLGASIAPAGSVVNDSSLGSAPVSHAGNIFTIGPLSGKQVGNNLFYSLSTLNLDKGETADFVNFPGSSSVQTVLTRVTGGPSNIDGTLECDIPNANFFLINSSGVVFGPDSALNVQGSFAVTTADQVKLADGKVFAALPAATDATLTTAAPAAFGFLSKSPAAITVNAATLAVGPGQSIMLVSGGVFINNTGGTGGFSITTGQLVALGGQIVIASVGSPGTAVLTGASPPSPPVDVSSFQSLGPIRLVDGAQINVNGYFGGQIAITGASAVLRDSAISAGSLLAPGAGIEINLRGDLKSVNSAVIADTDGTGPACPLNVTANSISIQGSLNIDSHFGCFSSDSFGSGDAGTVTINAQSLSVVQGGFITADAGGSGNAGVVTVNIAGPVSMDGMGGVPIPAAIGAGVLLQLTPPATGNGGTVTVSAKSLNILDGAVITASTEGIGNGGSVTVNVSGALVLDAMGHLTGIGANSVTATPADAGQVAVSAGSITLLDGAQILAGTTGAGNGGSLMLSSGGPIEFFDATVSADAPSSDGGDISIQTPAAVVVVDSQLKAAAGGTGGNITIDPALVVLQNSQLLADAIAGNGGNVSVMASEFLRNNSPIDVSSQFGVSGTVSVSPPDTEIAGSITPLRGEIIGDAIGLEPTCEHEAASGFSSFTVTGIGGLPPAPSGWLPSFHYDPDGENQGGPSK